MKKTLLCIALALSGFSATSYADEGYASIEKSSTETVFNKEALDNNPNKTLEVSKFLLPSNGIIALKNDGKLQLLTSNGRFVIKGVLYDTWAKRDLNTFEEIKEYASMIPLKSLNIKMEDLQSATWGKGPNQIIIFTDPYCEQCHVALKELSKLDPEKYTVQVLSIGALGDRSKKRNFELYCAKDRYRADRAIITGDNSIKFEQLENCDKEALLRREITAQVFGVSMIPFIIRNDGRYSVGQPTEGFVNFIKNGDK